MQEHPLPGNRPEVEGEERKRHSSGVWFLQACACGRSRKMREDPFNGAEAQQAKSRAPSFFCLPSRLRGLAFCSRQRLCARGERLVVSRSSLLPSFGFLLFVCCLLFVFLLFPSCCPHGGEEEDEGTPLQVDGASAGEEPEGKTSPLYFFPAFLSV
jgi:hypothetical protein